MLPVSFSVSDNLDYSSMHYQGDHSQDKQWRQQFLALFTLDMYMYHCSVISANLMDETDQESQWNLKCAKGNACLRAGGWGGVMQRTCKIF